MGWNYREINEEIYKKKTYTKKKEKIFRIRISMKGGHS